MPQVRDSFQQQRETVGPGQVCRPKKVQGTLRAETAEVGPAHGLDAVFSELSTGPAQHAFEGAAGRAVGCENDACFGACLPNASAAQGRPDADLARALGDLVAERKAGHELIRQQLGSGGRTPDVGDSKLRDVARLRELGEVHLVRQREVVNAVKFLCLEEGQPLPAAVDPAATVPLLPKRCRPRCSQSSVAAWKCTDAGKRCA